MTQTKVQFKEWPCILQFDRYAKGNRLCISLLHAEEGDPVATATVNIPGEEIEDDEVIIKDYSENEGMLTALVNAGVVSVPVRYVSQGFVICPVCKLLIDEQ
jgi:hypothetical protein